MKVFFLLLDPLLLVLILFWFIYRFAKCDRYSISPLECFLFQIFLCPCYSRILWKWICLSLDGPLLIIVLGAYWVISTCRFVSFSSWEFLIISLIISLPLCSLCSFLEHFWVRCWNSLTDLQIFLYLQILCLLSLNLFCIFFTSFLASSVT